MNQFTVSLWGDEAFASILSQKNLLDIVTIVAKDTSPPLHYMLLHFWMLAFGKSEIAIRTFPLFLFFLLAYVVYRMAGDIFDEKTAKIAAIFTLLNPFLFLYAFEGRMYMLLALTTALSMWFFMTRRWLLYVLATTASLYTHHFSMFIILVQLIYYIITNYRSIISLPLQVIKEPFVRSLIGVVVLYLPWLPVLYGQTTMVTGDFWLPRPIPIDLWKLYSHFITGFTNLPIESLVLLVSILLLFLHSFKKYPNVLLYLWFLLPGALTFVLSQFSRPIFFDRYLIVSAAAVPLLLSSQTRRLAVPLLVLIAAGLIFINNYSFQNPVKQPFRDVASFIHTAYGKDKVIINYYTNALHYFELKHYDVNVKIYSTQGPLPFWVGSALIDQNDILYSLPKDKILLIMASGSIGSIKIPDYKEVRRQQFRDLYLLWFLKTI